MFFPAQLQLPLFPSLEGALVREVGVCGMGKDAKIVKIVEFSLDIRILFDTLPIFLIF